MSSSKGRKAAQGARTTASSTKSIRSRRATPGSRESLAEFLDSVVRNVPDWMKQADQTSETVTQILKDAPSETQALSDFLRRLLDEQLRDLSSYQRVFILLYMVKNVRISQGRRDTLIEAAAEELTKFAFSDIWTAIENDELPPSDPESVRQCKVNVAGSEGLLEFACEGFQATGDMSACLKVCDSFMASLTENRPTELLRRLLRTLAFRLIHSKLDIEKCRPYIEFMQDILDGDSINLSFAKLLRLEEACSREEHAIFFQFQDVGSLMSVSFIPSIDESMDIATLPFDGRNLTGAIPVSDSHEEALGQFNAQITHMETTTENVQELLSSAFLKVLLSDNPELQQTALCWMAAVVNKNSISLSELSSRIGANHDTCEPRFLMNLCCVMLECLEVLDEDFKLSAAVDIGYFSSLVCKIDSSRLINLEGSAIQRESSDVDKRFNVATECYCLCLLATNLGVLNTMSLTLSWAESPTKQISCCPNISSTAARELVADLMTMAVGNDLLCEKVNKMYLILCNRILRLFETPKMSEKINHKDKKLALSAVPHFCITGMNSWISGLKHLLTEVDKFQPAPFLKVAVKLLLDTGMKLSCSLRFQLIETIVICVQELQPELAQKILPADVTELCGVLVETFVDVSSLDGLQVFSGTFNTCSARDDIVELFLFWSHEELGRALMALQKPDFLLTFLSGVLERTILECQNASEKFRQLVKEEADRSAEGNRQERAPVSSVEVVIARLLGKKKVLEFFSLLVENKDFVVLLTRPPLAVQTAVAVTCICNCLILTGTENEDLNIILRKLATEDTQETGSFLWSIAERLEWRHLILYCAVISKVAIHELFEPTYKKLKDKREQDQYILLDSSTEQNAPTHLSQDTLSQACLASASLVQSHTFRAVLETYKPASRKTETLKKEMEYLQKKLLYLTERVIYVVRDDERYDVLRCVVSGPVGTPYSGGLFVFDVYCPDGYPSVPPLVRFLTTGYGTADFHACLHINGEVFLNLLGTGFEDDGSGPWNPDKSTLRDVLESIQNVIFEEKPLFSYRSKQSLEKSQQGGLESHHYNLQVQLLTVRYAMLEQVRNPPPGLEGVIQQYFNVQRPALIKMYRHLMEEPLKEPTDYKLRWHMTALVDHLMNSKEMNLTEKVKSCLRCTDI